MKKFFLYLFFFIPFLGFAQTYHIQDVKYTITGSKFLPLGKTNIYALEQQVPVNTKIIFNTFEDFNNYLEEYRFKLKNTRAFETINVTYIYDSNNSTEDNKEVILFVKLQDSFHLIALPHVLSYNSNDGWKPKLKAKDSNFLGSLSTMSADFYGILPFESDNKNYEIGAEVDFIIPFKMGIFDSEWKNDYVFSYDFSKPSPEWAFQTGLLIKYPFEKCTLKLDLNQYAFRDYEYEEFDDITYFKEQAKLSLPINILEINNFGTLYYEPFTSIYYNWDFNGIHLLNEDLLSPTMTFGHEFYTSNINWNDNYRKGFSVSLENDYYYYIRRSIFIPYISLTSKAYTYFTLNDNSWFNTIGLTGNFYAFNYFLSKNANYYFGNSIGSRLRGIRDDQYFSDESIFEDCKALYTSSAIVLNLDVPFHIFTTNFNSKIMKTFNCEVQVSPFFDIALFNNRATNKTFSFKDGYYSGGFEVLVYPRKWSSFTIRGSLGFDLGRLLLKNQINMDWRKNVSKYEISIGLGLLY